ncbi:MAG: anthranilate phosphoribosyltransferase [Saprospiraceae bacterium]|jgi:anthranilate phosphoribosyltransferase
MKKILTDLFDHKKLSRVEAKEILVKMANNEYNEAQMAAFISVFLMRAISVDELQGFRDALLELCLPIDLEGIDSIDIVGTGGDGKNTFNISTISSFVIAGAGHKVTKHGNYGVSSACGSSNVLQHLGYTFTNDESILKKQLDQADICFFHAPLFHPAMKTVAPIRKQLGVKTFFNMLGPLVNPGQPKYQLLGVFNLELCRLYQYIFQQTLRQYAIVYAMDGYDEISLTGDFKLRDNSGEKMISPESMGKPTLNPEDLKGGDTVASAANIFTTILSGGGTTAQNHVITANAGLAIHCIKPAQSIQDCILEAEESLLSGSAMGKLKILVN